MIGHGAITDTNPGEKMILSEKHRFIFIKTRKTAGTSIQTALTQVCGAQDVIAGGKKQKAQNCRKGRFTYPLLKAKALITRRPLWPATRGRAKHATISDVTAVMGVQTDSYFKFAFVRNPFDLVVSRFFWDLASNRHTYRDFTLWLKQHYSREGRWERDLLHRYTHINGESRMDFIGRYEYLERDFRKVCTLLSLGNLELPRKKAGLRKPRHYSEFYTPQTRDLVARLFSVDLQLFDYRFEECS